MKENNSEKYFILSAILGGCVLISYLVFVVVRSATHDIVFASICFAIIAIALCGGTYHIFNKLYNLIPKSERERIKAEKLAEEEREKQPLEQNVKSPAISIAPPEVAVELHAVNTDTPKPSSTEPFANVQGIDTTITDDSYQNSIAAHENARKNRETDMVNAIMAYLKIAMPPFMPQDQLEKLCHEVLEWIKDPEYLPTEGVQVYSTFTTLDARHLIRSISERLGKNYIGRNRSMFVKKLFAKTCANLEELSIYKGMTEKPDIGHIKYDEPDEDGIAFHYELLEQASGNK